MIKCNTFNILKLGRAFRFWHLHQKPTRVSWSRRHSGGSVPHVKLAPPIIKSWLRQCSAISAVEPFEQRHCFSEPSLANLFVISDSEFEQYDAVAVQVTGGIRILYQYRVVIHVAIPFNFSTLATLSVIVRTSLSAEIDFEPVPAQS